MRALVIEPPPPHGSRVHKTRTTRHDRMQSV